MAYSIKTQGEKKSWETCHYCTLQNFKAPHDFERHLRERHCSQEGGSFVCRYGYNGVCASLPLDGVSDRDYESHVRKHHVLCDAAHAEHWSVYSAAQNLPAVLNDPNRAKQATLFTKLWGDDFIEKALFPDSPHLPEVTPAHFDAYLRRIGKKYRKHLRITAQGRTEAPPLAAARILSSEYDLSAIPSIFFKPNLPLNDSETFDSVFPGLGDASKDARAPCRLSQERLSHYLDIVEVQIAEQVSQKSDAFFHTMLSHDTIMEQMSSAIRSVRRLRGNISQTKLNLADDPLKLVRLASHKNNAASVLEKLKLMSTVHQTQPTIQLLLSTADYVTALDLIDTAQAILAARLSGVHAFRHLPSQLAEMERLIDKMLNTEFQRFAAADLNRPPGDEGLIGDDDKLASVVSGLLRRRRFGFIETYREEAVTTVQATVKQAMIEDAVGRDADGDAWVRGTGESGGWRAGGAELLGRAASRLAALFRRADALRRLVNRAAQTGEAALSESEDSITAEDQKTVESALATTVGAICDYGMERCASLISGGERDGPVDGRQMADLSRIVEDFTAECEEICGRPCPALRTALRNRAIRYVQRFHNERRTKLALLLDSERWKRAEVPSEFQAIADRIGETGRFPDADIPDAEEKLPGSCLIVNGEPFAVPGVALLAVRMIGEYCRAAEEIGATRPQVGKALAELLRAFNSRVCQLVLGAGALQSAGLKTITAANLALASRALQLVLWSLAAVRRYFADTEPDDALSRNLDGVRRDLEGHIGEIESKLSGIAGGLLGAQLDGWEARPPVPSVQFRSISRHLLKLHEALADVLPPEQLRPVFQTVHRDFKDKLRDRLIRMNVVGNGGPQHGVVTSELTFYLQTLVTLQVLPPEQLALNCMDDIWLK